MGLDTRSVTVEIVVVTAEVAGSSSVVPLFFPKDLAPFQKIAAILSLVPIKTRE